MNYLKVTPHSPSKIRLNKYSNITFDLDTRATIERGPSIRICFSYSDGEVTVA